MNASRYLYERQSKADCLTPTFGEMMRVDRWNKFVSVFCLGISIGAMSLCTPLAAHADPVSSAQAEATFTWYAAMSPDEVKGIAEEFMKRYPKIQVKYVVMRANQIPIRISTEQRAGKFEVDVLSASAWQVSALSPFGALQTYVPPEAKNLIPQAVDKNGQWFGEYILTIPIAYNTKTLAAQKLKPPASYEDLTKPEYKGKFSIETTDTEWFHVMLKAAGPALMKKIAANGPVFNDGHTTTLNGLIAGEFPISLGTYGYKAFTAAKSDHYPIVLLNAKPTVGEWQLVALAKNAPHPNAGKLFENWILSKEGQTFVRDKYARTPSRLDVVAEKGILDPAKDPVVYSDPNDAVGYADYANDFNSTFHINGQ
jgi:iron(III) transport system substrate-binding protein